MEGRAAKPRRRASTAAAVVLGLALVPSAAAVWAAVRVPAAAASSAGAVRASSVAAASSAAAASAMGPSAAAFATGPSGAATPASSAAPSTTARHPLVVLDPGHGGTNTGAASLVPGVYEKDLTLALAEAVARRLRQRGIAVALTRHGDRYVTLRQRVLMANRLGADLFISIHANATQAHSQRGFETWMLTPRALDIDARALRATDGGPHPGADPATAQVLDDVARGLAHPAAARLAAAIQAQLGARRGAVEDRGVRQGSMDVLLGADMPAVLVEVGFIDHPVEGRELLDPATLSGIADALAEAVASQTGRE